MCAIPCNTCLSLGVCSYTSFRKQILRIVIKCYAVKSYKNLSTHPSSGNNLTIKDPLHEDSKTFLRTSGMTLPKYLITYPCPRNESIPEEGEAQHHPSWPQYYTVTLTPRLLYPFTLGKEPRNPLNRRLCTPHSRSGNSGGVKHFLLLQRLEPQIFQSLPSSTILTTLCSLLPNLSGRNIFTKVFEQN
jgi:hypothetical protein